MYLELGFLPARFVIMEKHHNFLKYILRENKSSMIRQAFETLKTDSIKGDFVDLVKQDMIYLDIDMTEEEISNISRSQWKKFLNGVVKECALKYMKEENSTK